MYKIKKDVELDNLRKYGFMLGKEYPDNDRCICNDYEREEYWLIPFDEDYPNEKIAYADEDYDQPLWSIHIQSSRRVWIDCVPSGTYHIDNWDMEQMFYVIKQMIDDEIIEDDYKED